MSNLPKKLALCTASLAISVLFGWAFLEWSGALSREVDSVLLVDNTQQMESILERRRPQTTADTLRTAEGSDWPPALSRETIDEETARKVFYRGLQQESAYRYVPHAYIWQQPRHFWRTFEEHPNGRFQVTVNQAGFRKDQELLEERPDLRVIVTGDSHVAGVVGNTESFPNVLEQLLRARDPERSVEVLNAGIGGTNMYTYLGILEYTLEQHEFDAFVVTLYGGNDFSGCLFTYKYFEHEPSPSRGSRKTQKALRDLREGDYRMIVAQEVAQAVSFNHNPDLISVSATIHASITAEMVRLCEARGVKLICIYLPPAIQIQRELYAEPWLVCKQRLELETEHIEVSALLADNWLAYLELSAIPSLDLRPIFSQVPEPLYWYTDHHLNVRGHQLVAEALLPFFEAAD